MSFTIITDTSANLPTYLLKEKNIKAIPFSYFIDGKEHTCENTESFNGKAYYDIMRAGKTITTSQINPQKYTDSFEEELKKGNDILFVGMSSGISGAFNSAKIAASGLLEDYTDRQIILVDTLGASLGEGIPVLEAVKLKEQGLGLKEIETKLNDMCKRMYQIFTVDNLMHLKRSGRLSGAAAVVGTVLNIKPLLMGNDKGQIINFGKVRGRKASIEKLAELYDKYVVDAGSQIVGIANADCEEDAKLLAQLLRKNHPPKEILTVCYEPVTGSHVGPDTIALFLMGDENVRTNNN